MRGIKEDTVIEQSECTACGRTRRWQSSIPTTDLDVLQRELQKHDDDLEEEYDVYRDDDVALVVQDPTGRFQSDLRDIFGGDIEHLLHELARHSVKNVDGWTFPPVTVIRDREALAAEARRRP